MTIMWSTVVNDNGVSAGYVIQESTLRICEAIPKDCASGVEAAYQNRTLERDHVLEEFVQKRIVERNVQRKHMFRFRGRVDDSRVAVKIRVFNRNVEARRLRIDRRTTVYQGEKV